MQIGTAMTFGDSGLNRGSELRGDAPRMAALLASGRVLPVWRGKPLLVEGAALGWVAADSPVLAVGGTLVFLGMDADVACFAQDISAWAPVAEATPTGFFDTSTQPHPALPASHAFADLRSAMTLLTARAAELAASAKAVLHWHGSHGFCSACGAASVVTMAGWQRRCPVCGTQHFPRTDPVVIMLVTRGNRALLGRSPGWPDGMYSCLAGFMEPGETVEAAVRREVAEETGVTVGAVRYLASQPWPFPASLMIGCAAEATSDTITADPAEIEDALWLSREDMLAVFSGTHAAIKPARTGSIAHFLIANWLADRRI